MLAGMANATARRVIDILVNEALARSRHIREAPVTALKARRR
jgi:hypothetical protein